MGYGVVRHSVVQSRNKGVRSQVLSAYARGTKFAVLTAHAFVPGRAHDAHGTHDSTLLRVASLLSPYVVATPCPVPTRVLYYQLHLVLPRPILLPMGRAELGC
eukprot:320123-Rhodomonas_salina.1